MRTVCLGMLAAPLAGCGPAPSTDWSGYAEGDYVYVAAPLAGQLDVLTVQPGAVVRLDDLLFALDAKLEQAAVQEAQSRLAAAQAQVANADKGRRSEELTVTRAQLAQAQAAETRAQAAWVRQRDLVAKGFVSLSQQDDAKAALDQAKARVAELEAALRVAALPARSDERNATQAQADAVAQALRQSEWRLAQKQQRAPVAAQVAEVFFQVGEYVQPGQPVLSLLPPGAIKARFYVPETEVASLSLGQSVSLRCDGCGEPVAAHISRIATGPEFTPPVIYSNAQRAKLVFLVEARPVRDQAHRLRPGQPVDVRPQPRNPA